jgi:hypothetical protein
MGRRGVEMPPSRTHTGQTAAVNTRFAEFLENRGCQSTKERQTRGHMAATRGLRAECVGQAGGLPRQNTVFAWLLWKPKKPSIFLQTPLEPIGFGILDIWKQFTRVTRRASWIHMFRPRQNIHTIREVHLMTDGPSPEPVKIFTRFERYT